MDHGPAPQAFLTLPGLFDADDRRANAPDRANVIIVADSPDRQDLGIGAFAQPFAHPQHADVRIAAAASATASAGRLLSASGTSSTSTTSIESPRA
jgi:hypothetical protein